MNKIYCKVRWIYCYVLGRSTSTSDGLLSTIIWSDFYLSNNGSVYAWLCAVWCQFFGFNICLLSKIFPHNWFSAILPVRAQHTPHNRQSLYPFVNFIKVQSNRFSKMRFTNVGLSRCWWANNCTAHGWFLFTFNEPLYVYL